MVQWLREQLDAVAQWLDSLGTGVPVLPGWVLVALVAAVALVILLIVRPRANTAGRGAASRAVIPDRTLAPEDHRSAARAASAAGDHGAALAGWFRAAVREAEVRTVLDDRPGRTATEAASALAAVHPGEAAVLHRAAARFNSVRYGHRPATAAQAEAVRDLDARLRSAAAVPAPPPPAADSAAAPR